MACRELDFLIMRIVRQAWNLFGGAGTCLEVSSCDVGLFSASLTSGSSSANGDDKGPIWRFALKSKSHSTERARQCLRTSSVPPLSASSHHLTSSVTLDVLLMDLSLHSRRGNRGRLWSSLSCVANSMSGLMERSVGPKRCL